MILVDLVSWWYSRGWGVALSFFRTMFSDTADIFSIGEMFRTLFMPYKQITAGDSNSAVGRAVDRLISRLVGMFARLVIIISGAVVLLLETILSVVITLMWPIIPFLPVLGITMSVMGVIL